MTDTGRTVFVAGWAGGDSLEALLGLVWRAFIACAVTGEKAG